jgi:anti-sigma regulatory factor (Ser/Thr protein kinase)
VTAMTSNRPTRPHAHPLTPGPPPVPPARRFHGAWQLLDQRAGLSSCLELGPFIISVRFARRHARDVLTLWGLRGLADEAESVTDELVLNAVQATERAGMDTPVRLTILAGLQTVLISVWDAADGRPAVNRRAAVDLARFIEDDTADHDQHGRGLWIVQALSTRWGIRPARQGRGTVVWSELSIGAPAEHGERAPQR